MGHKKSGNSGWHEIDDASAPVGHAKTDKPDKPKPSPQHISDEFRSVCFAGTDKDGQVQAVMFDKDGKKILGSNFSSGGFIQELLGPKPLTSEWKGVGDSETPQRYMDKDRTKPIIEARENEGGFNIDVPSGTCTVTTVDGGGVPNKPVTTPLVIRPPGK